MSNLHRDSIPGARPVGLATRPAVAAEQRPVALPLSTPKLPSDLFAFLPSPWTIEGTTLSRPAIHRGRSVRVSVTTGLDSFERPRQTIACVESPSIDDVEVLPTVEFELYEAILGSAEDFAERHQPALVAAHGEGGS